MQIENQNHIDGSEDNADFQRNAEQKIEADGGADNFRKVGGADGKLCQKPERPCEETRISVPAGLRKIAPRGNGKPRAKCLQQNRHEVRQKHDREQCIAETGAASQRGGPVAGIHITDGYKIARAEK